MNYLNNAFVSPEGSYWQQAYDGVANSINGEPEEQSADWKAMAAQGAMAVGVGTATFCALANYSPRIAQVSLRISLYFAGDSVENKLRLIVQKMAQFPTEKAFQMLFRGIFSLHAETHGNPATLELLLNLVPEIATKPERYQAVITMIKACLYDEQLIAIPVEGKVQFRIISSELAILWQQVKEVVESPGIEHLEWKMLRCFEDKPGLLLKLLVKEIPEFTQLEAYTPIIQIFDKRFVKKFYPLIKTINSPFFVDDLRINTTNLIINPDQDEAKQLFKQAFLELVKYLGYNETLQLLHHEVPELARRDSDHVIELIATLLPQNFVIIEVLDSSKIERVIMKVNPGSMWDLMKTDLDSPKFIFSRDRTDLPYFSFEGSLIAYATANEGVTSSSSLAANRDGPMKYRDLFEAILAADFAFDEVALGKLLPYFTNKALRSRVGGNIIFSEYQQFIARLSPQLQPFANAIAQYFLWELCLMNHIDSCPKDPFYYSEIYKKLIVELRDIEANFPVDQNCEAFKHKELLMQRSYLRILRELGKLPELDINFYEVMGNFGLKPVEPTIADSELQFLSICLPNIRSINFQEIHSRHPSILGLSYLSQFNHLRHVELAKDPTYAKSILTEISKVKTLQSLTINHSVDSEALSLLKNLPNLKKLEFNDAALNSVEFEKIFELSRLKVLILNFMDLAPIDYNEDEDIYMLGPSNDLLGISTNMPNLKILELDSCNRMLTNGIFAHISQFSKLKRLKANRVEDENLADLVNLQNLTSVDISGTGISNAGLNYVSKIPKLHHLKINVIPAAVTCDGASDLFESATLQHLDAWGLPLSDDSLKTLSCNANLHTVILRESSDIPKNAPAHLQKCRNLEVLAITSMEEFSLIKAGQFLAQLKRLKRLTLSIPLTDEDLDYLSKAPKLEYLECNQGNITADGLANFQKKKPHCEVFLEKAVL